MASDGMSTSTIIPTMRPMAVLMQLSVPAATQDQFNELDAKVGSAMMHAGGPPPGLMSHVSTPAVRIRRRRGVANGV